MLAMANYAISPEPLLAYLPPHTELDLWDGKCYVSLVGFMFTDTRLKGIRIPFHTNFEEVNLRFYVRHRSDEGDWKRGVVFISELVPKRALAWVANTIYKERYRCVSMEHAWVHTPDSLWVEYKWKTDQWQQFSVEASPVSSLLTPGSMEEFITEHYWGYSRLSPTQTTEYQVSHPSWRVHKVNNYRISVDFAQLYGLEFAVLNTQIPDSVFLAEGSVISVHDKKIIC